MARQSPQRPDADEPELDDTTGTAEWRQALRHTIRAGLVFDVAELLSDIREMVAEQKEQEASTQ